MTVRFDSGNCVYICCSVLKQTLKDFYSSTVAHNPGLLLPYNKENQVLLVLMNFKYRVVVRSYRFLKLIHILQFVATLSFNISCHALHWSPGHCETRSGVWDHCRTKTSRIVELNSTWSQSKSFNLGQVSLLENLSSIGCLVAEKSLCGGWVGGWWHSRIESLQVQVFRV